MCVFVCLCKFLMYSLWNFNSYPAAIHLMSDKERQQTDQSFRFCSYFFPHVWYWRKKKSIVAKENTKSGWVRNSNTTTEPLTHPWWTNIRCIIFIFFISSIILPLFYHNLLLSGNFFLHLFGQYNYREALGFSINQMCMHSMYWAHLRWYQNRLNTECHTRPLKKPSTSADWLER